MRDQSHQDRVFVLAASYKALSDAESDYDAVKAIYTEKQAPDDFDAAVVERDTNGKGKLVDWHEGTTSHGSAHGGHMGHLAVSVAHAIFRGLATAGEALDGAPIGSPAGAIDDDDLRGLGEVLNRTEAGLIVGYSADVADRVSENIKAVDTYVSKPVDANADQLAEQFKESELD